MSRDIPVRAFTSDEERIASRRSGAWPRRLDPQVYEAVWPKIKDAETPEFDRMNYPRCFKLSSQIVPSADQKARVEICRVMAVWIFGCEAIRRNPNSEWLIDELHGVRVQLDQRDLDKVINLSDWITNTTYGGQHPAHLGGRFDDFIESYLMPCRFQPPLPFDPDDKAY